MQMALRINLIVAYVSCRVIYMQPSMQESSTVSWRVHSSNEHSYIELYYYKALQSITIIYDVAN